jgi:tRNA pseudouridine65 synthase
MITVEQLPLTPGVRVLSFNKDGLVALDKPAGVRSHPNTEDQRKPSILEAAYDYDGEVFSWQDAAGHECQAWLINRLDSPTSGILLLGLNPEIAAVIKQQFAEHKVDKVYYGSVRHKPKLIGGTWVDRLRKPSSHSRPSKRPVQEVPAMTRYKWMKSPSVGLPISLIKLMPMTGRTHQLRIQCHKHGHPIVGDRTYGDFSFNREVSKQTHIKRMFLHAGSTSVRYAFEGKSRSFEANSPLPEDFETVLDFRPGVSRGIEANRLENKPNSRLSGRRFRH